MSDTEMVKTLNLLDARVIQMEDIEETAAWCNGDIGIMYEGRGEGQHYIQIDDVRGTVGEWIGKTKLGFVILSDAEYRHTFHAASHNRDRYKQVLDVIKAAVADSVSDLHGKGSNQSLIAEAAALRIMEFLED